MNKAELVEALSVHFDGNKAEAGRALNAVVETIVHETARDGKVSITGFGVFEKVHRPARMVRNPRTGERKKAKATSVPRFRAGTDLKAFVSGEKKVPKASAAKATAAKSAAKPSGTKSAATKSAATKTAATKTAATTKTTAATKKTATKKTAAPAKTTTTKKAPARKAAKKA